MSTCNSSKLTRVFITNVIDPLFFHAIIGPENYVQIFTKCEAKWAEGAQSLGPVAEENLQIGQLVMVSSSQWKKMVRAKISRIIREEDTEVDVFCIDYGTSEIVSVRDVCPGLDASWCSLREHAVCCKIAGVKPIAKTWTSRAVEFFTDCVLCKELDMQIYSLDSDGSYSLEVITEVNEELISLSELLIEEGMAAPENIYPNKGCVSIPDFHLGQFGDCDSGQITITKASDSHSDDAAATIGPLPANLRYGKSDETLGKMYKPNVEVVEVTIRDELNNYRRQKYGTTAKAGGHEDGQKNKTSVGGLPRAQVKPRTIGKKFKSAIAPRLKSSKDLQSTNEDAKNKENKVGGSSRFSEKREKQKPSRLRATHYFAPRELKRPGSRLEEKIRKILNVLPEDKDFVKAKLKSIVYPAVCAGDELFPGTLSELLWTLEREFIQPGTDDGTDAAFGSLVGQLCSESQFWGAIRVCTYRFVEKWSTVQEDLSEIEAQSAALKEVLTAAGEELGAEHLNMLNVNLTAIILEENVPRHVRAQYLEILVKLVGGCMPVKCAQRHVASDNSNCEASQKFQATKADKSTQVNLEGRITSNSTPATSAGGPSNQPGGERVVLLTPESFTCATSKQENTSAGFRKCSNS